MYIYITYYKYIYIVSKVSCVPSSLKGFHRDSKCVPPQAARAELKVSKREEL